jgi:hypothetical protein
LPEILHEFEAARIRMRACDEAEATAYRNRVCGRRV